MDIVWEISKVCDIKKFLRIIIPSLLHAFSHKHNLTPTSSSLCHKKEKKNFALGSSRKNNRAINDTPKTQIKDERQKRLDEVEKHRAERMKKRQYLRKMATQQFYKSMQMLQANAKREKDEPFEDYSIFLYRQTAPDFKDRVKDLEQKILYPVSRRSTTSADVW